MCTICILIDKEMMKPLEIARAYMEYTVPDEHMPDLIEKIKEKDGRLAEVEQALWAMRNK